MNVLFIGNSFTYYNDMIDMVNDIAQANGKNINVRQIAYGGYQLSQYIDESDKWLEVKEVLSSKEWDYVLLQEQSSKPYFKKKEFIESVIELDKLIKSHNSETILYSTWSYKDGSKILNSIELSYDEFYLGLKSSYKEASNLIKSKIADVGSVFALLHSKDKQLNVYVEDEFHPNVIGSFIAAQVIYETIFGEWNTRYYIEELGKKDFDLINKWLRK